MEAPTQGIPALPPVEVLHEIERIQTQNGEQIRAQRKQSLEATNTEVAAAEMIQRNYRGYRARQAMQGHALDPSLRWVEAIKDAKYAAATKPQSRANTDSKSPEPKGRARNLWSRAAAVAHHAGSDDTSDEELDAANEEEKAKILARRRTDKEQREQYAKVMGMEYFLEMVDHKHRYGSSLRKYHQVWQKADTRENFFYWLDEGEGKDVDLEERPRERLDRERIRYLSRAERKHYLVTLDAQGRFRWDRDGALITTSIDYKDSIDGIVPANDKTPTWREVTTGEKPPIPSDSSSDASSVLSTGGQEDGSKYTNDELHDAKGIHKLQHVSVDALTNHMLRKTTKKNTWIFVADTSFRLYIGIKQSGAFQHSSFLKGARVSAAGLIKIKEGQIRKLSPLSGHYAPPVKNFRKFMASLKEHGADLSRLNVSRSYAVILGLESYIGVKKQAQQVGQGIHDVFRPEDKKRRQEEAQDRSQSAEKERLFLEKQAKEKRSKSTSHRLMKKLGLRDDNDDT